MEWLRNFMYGRNGPDGLSFALMVAGLAFSIASRFALRLPFYLISIILYGLAVFRILSRNLPARQKENATFMNFTWEVKNRWRKMLAYFEERKYFRHYKCSVCSQKIRVPRGRGKIEIRCPKCGNTFIKKA